MLITAEWFETLSKNLKTVIAQPSASAKGAENRRHARVGVRSITSLREISQDGRVYPAMTVTVRDFSAEGVGILLTKRMNKDDRFMLELPREDGSVLRLLYVVRISERLPGNLFGIGAKLMGARNIDGVPERANPAQPPQSEASSEAMDIRAAEIRKRMFDDAGAGSSLAST
jgi:hypothetical protein